MLCARSDKVTQTPSVHANERDELMQTFRNTNLTRTKLSLETISI